MISLRSLTVSAFVASLLWSIPCASQQVSQQQEAGEIREIKCKGYLQRPNEKLKKLNPKRDKGLKLYPLDQVKCDGAGTLEVVLHGRAFSVNAEYDWYPIPVPNNPRPSDTPVPGRVGFRGTYRLERGPNDIGEPGYSLPDDWTKPLKPPSILAIDISGHRVTIASSLFSKFAFDADGREREVETSQAETMKVVAEFKENTLTIRAKTETSTTLEAVFSLQVDGKLKVTQSLSGPGIASILKEANYLQVSDVASLDIFPTDSAARPTPVEGVLLRKGEQLVAEVDSDIVSFTAKEGDEFSLTVKAPAKLKGAKIKGHLSDIKRTSEGDELHLNFEVIILTNKTGYLFPGKMEVNSTGRASSAAARSAAQAGEVLGIVSSRKQRPSAATGEQAAIGVSFVKIEKGTEIIMTPLGPGPP